MECEADSLQFVSDCQEFYGKYFMTFNVHAVLHLVESVRKNGPLFACSAFVYESYMSRFKNFISGTTAVMQQIAKKTLQCSTLQFKITTMEENNPVMYFCKHLFEKGRLTFDYCVSVEGAVVIGLKTIETRQHTFKIYLRCISNGTVYHSEYYKRSKITNNTFAQLTDNTFVKIVSFSIFNNECDFYYRKVEIESDEAEFNGQHIFRVIRISNEISDATSVTFLQRKVIHLEINDDNNSVEYVCIYPNKVKAN